MNSDEDETDLYEEKIEPNRIHIVKVINPKWFYDRLRSCSVLSECDCEEVESNRTRWQKAGALLDILRTKGNNGVVKFLEILEFENPECYRKVTKKEPRQPPHGYNVGSDRHESQFISLLDKLPQVAKDMAKDYQEKKDLTNKLKDMTELLQLELTEKKEMEREIENLRRFECELRQKAHTLESNLSIALKQIEKLKDDSMEYLKNSLELSKERDHYREKWNNTQMEKDEQERQNQNLKEQFSCVKDELARTKRESSSLLPRATGMRDDVPQRPDLPPKPAPRNMSEENSITREQILRDQRDEVREKCEELSLQLERLTLESEDYQNKYQREKERLERMRRERDQLEGFLKQKTDKNERYFQMIQQLEQDKKTIEEEKRKEQSKNEVESEKRRQLFMEKHELENRYEALKTEHERLKIELRNSMSLLPETDSSSHFHALSSESDGDHEPSSDNNAEGHNWPGFDCEVSENILQLKSATLPNTLQNDKPHIKEHTLQRQSEVYTKPSCPPKPEKLVMNVPRRPIKQRSPTVEAQVGWSFKNPDSRIGDVDDPFRQRVDTGLLPLKTQREEPEGPCHDEPPGPCTGGNHRVPPSSASETSEDSSMNEFVDLITYEVVTALLPPDIVGFQNEELDSECFTAIVKTPVLREEKFEITGGNWTGIFINKLFRNIGRLCVGDQILMLVCHNAKSSVDKQTKDLKGYTLEDAQKLLDKTTGTDIEMKIRQRPQNYKAVQMWLEGKQTQGDYFFIRSHINWDGTRKIPDGMLAHIGDIFLVVTTYSSAHEKFWKAIKFDTATDKLTDTTGFIPNEKEARKYQYERAWSRDDEVNPLRSRAFRYRSSPYVKVLPVKATSKMPILLFGKDELVEAIRALLVTDVKLFMSHDTVKDGQMEIKYLLRQDKHLILKNPNTRSYPAQNISLCIGIDNQTDEVVKNLFDKTMDCSEFLDFAKSKKDKLDQQAIHCEIFTINCTVIKDKESLLSSLKQTVSGLQERMVWLSEKQLDRSIVDQHMTLLGSLKKNYLTASSLEDDMYISVDSACSEG